MTTNVDEALGGVFLPCIAPAAAASQDECPAIVRLLQMANRHSPKVIQQPLQQGMVSLLLLFLKRPLAACYLQNAIVDTLEALDGDTRQLRFATPSEMVRLGPLPQ